MNFTVTRSSLQSQCLNEVLKAERPDVDEKRSDLLKLQGMVTKIRVTSSFLKEYSGLTLAVDIHSKILL